VNSFPAYPQIQQLISHQQRQHFVSCKLLVAECICTHKLPVALLRADVRVADEGDTAAAAAAAAAASAQRDCFEVHTRKVSSLLVDLISQILPAEAER
jgi:hypothetical protein